MNLKKYKLENYRLKKFRPSQEELKVELDRYNHLLTSIKRVQKDITMLKNNFSKYQDAKKLILTRISILNKLREKFYSDVFDVGKTKAVGYLPEDYYKELGEGEITYLLDHALKNNLEVYISNRFSRPSVVVYHKMWIQLLLVANKELIINNNIPTDADEFIKFIMNETVDYQENPELYTFIAVAFNDSRIEKIA